MRAAKVVLAALGAVSLACAIAVFRMHYYHWLAPPKKGKPIPGPRQRPLLGNLPDVMKYKDNVALCLLHWAIKYVRWHSMFLFNIVVWVYCFAFAGSDVQNGVLSIWSTRGLGELARGSEAHDFHGISARKIR